MGTAAELAQSSESLLKKVSSGKIAPSDAREILALMEERRKIMEAEQFEGRLRVLEERASSKPGSEAASLQPGGISSSYTV